MSNRYTSGSVSIIPSEGCGFNEATTFNNNHYNRPITNNDSTNQIVGKSSKIWRSNRKTNTHK